MKGNQGNKLRRQSAISLLEAQLKKGTKPERVDGKTTTNEIPLEDGDIKRIKREIETLKGRISKVSA